MPNLYRTLLATLFTFGSVVLLSGQFTDDFNDGDLTNGPVWAGSTVFIANASGQLQLNDVVAASSYLQSDLAMPSLDNMEWRIKVKQSFSPSSSNYGRVYLVSDQIDLFGPLNGYYLQFGEALANDAIELFAQTGMVSTSVCRGVDMQIANAFDLAVKVLRDGTGQWQLLVDPIGGTNYVLQASGANVDHTSGSNLGVQCVYTAGNANKFFYDDVYVGPIVVDNAPPAITAVEILDATHIDVVFDEPVELATANTVGNYNLLPAITVGTAIRNGVQLARVHLTLATGLVSGTDYTLTVQNVEDLLGNAITSAQFAFNYFVPAAPEFRNVVINEIMADQSPVVGLPEVEFVELYNATTDRTFDLAGWTFSDGGTPAVLPTYTLLPGEYVVVMATASLPLFPSIANKIGVSGFPSMNNDGDPLMLKDNLATTIDAVTYALSWYQDPVKADGGWTLEQIDPTSPCSGASNWRASNAPAGGTPGSVNSIYAIVPDTQAPTLLSVQVLNDLTLEVTFSEAMDVGSLIGANYFIAPTIATGDVFPNGTNGATVQLLQPLEVGTVYTLVVEDASDCPGNLIAGGNTAQFALPEPVEPGDVVINEVLYDPYINGVDFVELYNRSQKTLSLAGWKMANVTSGVIASPVSINSAMLMLPGTYVVITSDAVNISSLYPQSRTERFVQNALPSYNNDEGSVVLQGPDGSTLDRFDYNDDLHFTLVNNPEGYSLERVDPDRVTDDNTNWQTAADIAGKATPGFVNSQYSKTNNASGDMTIEPAIFSPDNDGFQDLLTVGYRFEQAGFVGNMIVYDVVGREVKKLMENQLLGTEGAISWNGIMDSGSLGRIGPYIVVLEVYDLAGNVDKFKKTVTLAHRL